MHSSLIKVSIVCLLPTFILEISTLEHPLIKVSIVCLLPTFILEISTLEHHTMNIVIGETKIAKKE